MPAAKGTVCNINLFLKLRLCFGFYSHVFESGYKRYLLKILLVVISCFAAYVPEVCSLNGAQEYTLYSVSRSIEYLGYVFCALQSEDEYLIEYFTVNLAIDNRNYSNIYRKIVTALYVIMLLIVIGYAPYCLALYMLQSSLCEASLWISFKLFYFRVGNEIGFLPLGMVFLLFYCRIEIFCKRIREEVIKSTSTFQWRKYLSIYVNIKSALKKTDWPLKFMMFLHIFIGFIKVTNIQYNLFKFNTNRVLPLMDIIYIAAISFYLVFIYVLIFLPSIIFEMIMAKLENLRVELADAMIMSEDESRRQNLQQLLRCLREQPPRYTLWRAVEVNARLPLAFLSFSATLLVCQLQLSHIL